MCCLRTKASLRFSEVKKGVKFGEAKIKSSTKKCTIHRKAWWWLGDGVGVYGGKWHGKTHIY